jgi:hypothetical protein
MEWLMRFEHTAVIWGLYVLLRQVMGSRGFIGALVEIANAPGLAIGEGRGDCMG